MPCLKSPSSRAARARSPLVERPTPVADAMAVTGKTTQEEGDRVEPMGSGGEWAPRNPTRP